MEDDISLEAWELRDYTDYAYVTLACDDEQIDAHKLKADHISCFLGGLFRFARGFILGFQADLFQGVEVIVTMPALVTG